MKIGYKKGQIITHLLLGIFWCILGFSKLLFEDDSRWSDYVFLGTGLLYLLLYVFQKKSAYVAIENGILRLNGPLGKKINLDEVKCVEKNYKAYTLRTDSKKLSINTNTLDPNALSVLTEELEKLDVEWV